MKYQFKDQYLVYILFEIFFNGLSIGFTIIVKLRTIVIHSQNQQDDGGLKNEKKK